VTDASGFNLGRGVLDHRQPRVSAAQVDRAKGILKAYRFMAFLTGIVLLTGCLALILKGATSWDMEPGTGYLWVAHGYLYLVYVIVTGVLGVRLQWPLGRYALVMLAGTIPTASFVAEHFVTRATRGAADAAPVPARD
jgi:integral membrane protein